MVIVIDNEPMDYVPDSLEEFFESYPSIGEANEALTTTSHTNMWRDQVLFIKQRQQATSDYRENPKVRWIGSHAAMTCHIAVMRHRISGVVSIGHFDNFCCWQFGENSSAHRDGLDIMVREISALSCDNSDNIEIGVYGGYTDIRGDAAKNSLSLLKSLYSHWCVLHLKHFCVGKYNTMLDEYGNNTAILKGIAVDLQTQILFPAIFAWGQYEDFKSQIKDKYQRIMSTDSDNVDGANEVATRTARITADSTFKPKSLKNQARAIELIAKHDEKQDENKRDPMTHRLKKIANRSLLSNDKDNDTIEAFKIQLKPIKPLTPSGSKSVISHDPWSSSMPNQKSRKLQHNKSSRGGNAVNKPKLNNKNNKQ